MAYSGLNCKGYSYRFVAGDYENLATVSHVGGPNMNDYISSIGKCRSSIRGTHVQFHLGTGMHKNEKKNHINVKYFGL